MVLEIAIISDAPEMKIPTQMKLLQKLITPIHWIFIFLQTSQGES